MFIECFVLSKYFFLLFLLLKFNGKENSFLKMYLHLFINIYANFRNLITYMVKIRVNIYLELANICQFLIIRNDSMHFLPYSICYLPLINPSNSGFFFRKSCKYGLGSLRITPTEGIQPSISFPQADNWT